MASLAPGVRVGPAYIFRATASASDNAIYGAITVRNTGTRALSFVKGGNIVFKDGAGGMLGSNDFTYVVGSVGRLSGSLYNKTDAPGWWAHLSKLAFGTVTAESWALLNPAARVIPRSIVCTPGSYFWTITAGFRNFGTATALLAECNPFILLDANQRPIYWSYFSGDVVPATRLVGPGVAGTVTDRYMYFAGLSAKAVVLMDFDVPSSGGSSVAGNGQEEPSTSSLSGAELAQWALDQRNKREGQKRDLLLQP